VVATEEYHRLVEAVEVGFELFRELLFAFGGGGCPTEAEAVGDTVDVGVDGHEVGLGVLDHDDVGGFLADAGQFDKLFLLEGDLSSVVFDDRLRHFDEVFGLIVEKRTRFDVRFDVIEIGMSQGGGIGIGFKKCRSNDVNPFVGALG